MLRAFKSIFFHSSALAVTSICVLALAACGGGAPPLSPPSQGKHSVSQALPPLLGSAQTFAVLASSTVTNTGATTVRGDLGVQPGLAVIGFPPGQVLNGTIHEGDTVALQAQTDLTTAYNSLQARPCTSDLTGKDLGGMRLTQGVYCFTSSAQLTGTVELDAQGSADAVFVFQIGSTLTTASGASVRLINGAGICNVYWQVGSSATIGASTSFTGNILALASVSLTTGAVVSGRALARTGAVTMDTNTIDANACQLPPPPPPPECTTDAQCTSGKVCTDGKCVAASPECTTNAQCTSAQVCTDGKCVAAPPPPPECTTNAQCTSVQVCRDNKCVDVAPHSQPCCNGEVSCGALCTNLKTDANHCGSCGTSCAATEVCSAGACVPCPASRTQCKDQCADVTSDAFNCGGCGIECIGSQSCVAGSCTSCDGTVCGNACIELSNDNANCGACGHACAATECCEQGACTSGAVTTATGSCKSRSGT